MVHSVKDMIAGALFVAVGLVFLVWSLLTLRMGTPSHMGPGYFPTVLGGLLCLLGAAVVLSGLRRRPGFDLGKRLPVPWRAILMIGLSPVVFALTIERLGLIPSAFLMLLVAVFASPHVSPAKGIVVAAGFTLFCVVVFKFGLGVTFDLTWL